MKYYTAFLLLLSLYKGTANDTSYKDVTAFKGTSFNITFSHNSPITYCWFLAPNGTYFSVIPNSNNSNLHHEYDGTGFNYGDCGIKIKYASPSDDGEWRCNMGINGTSDKRSFIRVKVYETTLIAKTRSKRLQKNVNITCEMFDKSQVEYCRFIRPDGRGIYPLLNSNIYSNFGSDEEKGICVLQIKYTDVLNFGNWTCIAKPKSENVELFDRVLIFDSTYHNKTSTFMSVFFWTISIIAILAVIIISSMLLFKIRVDAIADREVSPPFGRSNAT